MTTTYTSSIRMTNQPKGGNATTWGDIADINFEHLDDALAGRVSIDLTGTSSYTLTVNNGADDEARNMNLYIHGVMGSASQDVIIPAVEKVYLVKNVATGFNPQLKTATGTGIVLGSGESTVVYCDGVSVERYGLASALDPSANLSDVADASVSRSNLGLSPQSPLETSGSALTLNTGTLFETFYPVGSLYMNRTDSTNPATLLGFGVWSAITGRAPVGVGTGIDANGVSVVFAAETCGGEYLHTMTTAEMVSHSHDLDKTTIITDPGLINTTLGAPSGTSAGSTSAIGSSEPFNIQDPWYSVYMWVRDS